METNKESETYKLDLNKCLQALIEAERRNPAKPRITSVTERALLRRINRRLGPQWRRMHKSRPHERPNLGRFHIVCTYTNTLLYSQCDLEEWARDLNAIGHNEKLEN